ncbi:PBP1A family penicillin-binding protein [Lapidilactobacillus bayanensis]|uniref:PBP1A family penicillin-binding protein n=1 Tax=Lapidilactobacillus bayanensis TaxID=2485998 RepID=UPI000F7B7C8E|nr:PBP1A family penicillin-binding protein [Lapidilactobacillus bayanensis]
MKRNENNIKTGGATTKYPYLSRFWREFKVVWRHAELTRWVILVILLVFLGVSAFYTIKAKTANVGDLKASLKTTTTDILDRDGDKAGSLYSQKGTFVEFSQISPNIQHAVIATEDRTFYTNLGFSIKGIARAAVSYVIHHGTISGGGSTITQQLAKNMLLTQKQTFGRKIAELFMAIEINRVYSKQDVLTMYLNNAYFGNGVWGVQDASKRYFGKNASDLTAAQGATLVAMLRNPTYYDPVKNPKNATSRRNLVLDLETQTNYLTADQAAAAKQEAMTITDTYSASSSYRYPYYFDAVISEAINDYGISESDILNKGYKIYTSLDQNYQTQMQNAYNNDSLFPSSASDGVAAQSGSVAVNPSTGGVLAVVGRRGTHTFRSYDYATMAKRQPGSAIKPLAVYTPALENGYHYDSELVDKDTTFGKNNYHPTNVDGTYLGKVAMYQALAQSRNVPAVWLLDQIGVSKGVASVEKFGINVPKADQNLALALGGLQTGVSPLQMAQAYTAFANNGKMTTAHFITKIVDATGAVIVDNTKTKTKTVLSQKNAETMTSMMLGVFNQGTGIGAKPDGYVVAGKTGTTEVPDSYPTKGAKDQWVLGYTPDIVVATWVGYDKTDESHYLTGSYAPRIFKQEMTNILPYTPKTSFKTKDAATIASQKSETSSSGGNWLSDFSDNVGKSFDNAKDQVNQWYNNVKGLFGQ